MSESKSPGERAYATWFEDTPHRAWSTETDEVRSEWEHAADAVLDGRYLRDGEMSADEQARWNAVYGPAFANEWLVLSSRVGDRQSRREAHEAAVFAADAAIRASREALAIRKK